MLKIRYFIKNYLKVINYYDYDHNFYNKVFKNQYLRKINGRRS